MTGDEAEDPLGDLAESVADREGDPFAGLTDSEDEDDGEASIGEGSGGAGPREESSTAEPAADESTGDADVWTPAETADGDPAENSFGADETPGTDPSEEASTADPFEEMETPTAPEELEDALSGGDWGSTNAEGVESSAPASMPGTFDSVEEPAIESAEGAAENNDPFSEGMPGLEEFDLGNADEDVVWEALSAAEAADSVADVRDQTYAEVSKHTFCETCEYFTGPPEASCTHEGTRILEFLDMETVRVVDCPVVAERRALGQDV